MIHKEWQEIPVNWVDPNWCIPETGWYLQIGDKLYKYEEESYESEG